VVLITCLVKLLGSIQRLPQNTNNRSVTYNYLDSTKERPIWSTNASSLFTRTTWEDSAVFGLPHASKYDAGDDDSFDVVGNTDGVSIILNMKLELINRKQE